MATAAATISWARLWVPVSAAVSTTSNLSGACQVRTQVSSDPAWPGLTPSS